MTSDPNRSDEQCIEIGLKAIADYASGEYTLDAVCKLYNIRSRATLWRWVNFRYKEHLKQPFEDAKKMVDQYTGEIRLGRALSGLDKLLDVHEYDEVKKINTPIYETGPDGKVLVRDGKPVIKAMKTRIEKTTKTVMPQFGAIKFQLQTNHPDYKPIGKDGDVPVDLEGAEDNAYYYTMPDGTKLKF